MDTKYKFQWRSAAGEENGLEYIILECLNAADPGKSLEAWIAPSAGSNMCRLAMGGRNIIDFESDLLRQKDYTGTPVLYPTPNRVRNGMFLYDGKIYNQQKRGEPVFEHGLVHNEAWSYENPDINEDCVRLKTWIDFDEESPLFEAFPFRHRLEMEFTLYTDGIEVKYSIFNMDNKTIPFGFGVHPYFMKLSGEDGTYVSLPANQVMDYTSDLLPTGRLIEVDGTIYDIRNDTKIGALDMDHVFTGILEGEHAEINYRSLGMKVELQASEDFTHLVLYSPAGKEFFCIENQTCSTDAHNLFDRGFKSQSGLKFVPAGKTHTGTVKYVVKRGDRI